MAQEATVVETGKTGEVVATGNEATPINDDAIVEYQVRGETVRKPWKEAKGGYMMQEDYTRSKQEVAARAKELEGIHGKLSEREKVILSREAELEARRKMVDQVLSGKPIDTNKKVEVADDDVMTGAQVKELLKQTREEFDGKLNSKTEQVSGELRTQQQFERWEDLTQKTIDTLQTENPILKRMPHLDVVLKREAMKDNPKSEKELVDAYVKAGKNLAKGLDDEFDERVKQAAIKKTKIQETAPDRVTGQPVFTTKKTYMKKNNSRSIDWDDIERDVISAVESQEE